MTAHSADPRLNVDLGIKRLLLGLTVTFGAFLLFLIQPLIANRLLPDYGGSASVWIVGLLFFQAVLFGGYYYAHLLVRWVTPLRQVQIHSAMMLLAILAAFTEPGEANSATVSPTLDLLLVLALRIGFPFLLLAATSPLVQHWYSANSARPYRLYALSNAGSLGALVIYPFLVEPWFDLSVQFMAWLAGLILYLVFCLGLSRYLGNIKIQRSEPSSYGAVRGGLPFLLAATGTVVLLSVSTVVTRQIAPVPLLGVLPLSIYLITYILAFDHPRWYGRRVVAALWLISIGGVIATYLEPYEYSTPIKLTIYCLLIFSSCFVCHAEIARRTPLAQDLTSYYLWIAAGGVFGALLVSVISPLVFTDYYEFELALIATLVLGGYALLDGNPGGHKVLATLWIAAVALLAAFFANHYLQADAKLVASERSFYARYKIVHEGDGTEQDRYELYSDHIVHGTQLRAIPRLPTTYYSTPSGIGLALDEFPGRNRKVGIVGLGAGTLAAYGEPGDQFRFYELDHSVIELSQRYFSYLANSAADIQLIQGDGRLALEREARVSPGSFDILVLDAFSGDSVPTHLLTREAWNTYWQVLSPDGILAVHVSNIYFDLMSVVLSLNDDNNPKKVLKIVNDYNQKFDVYGADWLLVTNRADFLSNPRIRERSSKLDQPRTPVWTDEASSVLRVLRLR